MVSEPRCIPTLWKQHLSGRLSQANQSVSLLPNQEAATIDEWLYNGGPYQLIVFLSHRYTAYGTTMGT